jgi:hypothetical protein
VKRKDAMFWGGIQMNDLYRPLRYFAYFFIVIGLLGFVTLVLDLCETKYLPVVWTFVGSVSLFHLLLGMGVLFRKKWGFTIFKGYLYLLYIGFPIGTYIGYKTLKYIDENRIEAFVNK